MAHAETLQREALRVLFEIVCICGQPKGRRKAFCSQCWNALPKNMRPTLYMNYSNHSVYANFWDHARRFLAKHSNRPIYTRAAQDAFPEVSV
jgi:hypothetical protein